MCGITGFNWKDEALGKKMSDSISYRGPDASGTFTDEGITFSHRRLSIIDLSPEANQPMKDNSGELVITYNGEIYNFKELRAKLLIKYDFKTESDTEVILAGYKVWGKDIVKHLNGIFAFAIWDKASKNLFCARDHMGVKPLYYYWDNRKFIFASEIKAILEHDIPRILNKDSFNRYMRVLYAPEPETMVKGIMKLPSGSTLLLQNGKVSIEKYYSPIFSPKEWSYNEAKETVKKTVSDASVRQLISDVPVGVYLSGGVDSSVILASVSKVKKNVKTFSVGFELSMDEQSDKFNRDFDLAALTAKHFGAEHHPLKISVNDVARKFEEIIGHLDDPISNPTAISMAFLSEFAKKGVTVTLSGNGGDELFGGYERYRLSVISDTLRKVPWATTLGIFSNKIRKILTPAGVSRLSLFEFEKDVNLKKVISPAHFSPSRETEEFFGKYLLGEKDFTNDFMFADQKSWLPDYALLLSDKMGMRNSIEERVPLLDREVLDLSNSIPRNFKVDAFGTKKILKDAFSRELPEALFHEPKRGWFSPGAKWLRRKEITDIAKEILNSTYHAGTSSLFNWNEVKQMLDRHLENKEYNLTILWAIITFQIWARRYNITL